MTLLVALVAVVIFVPAIWWAAHPKADGRPGKRT
jgi:hypothetical protein